MQTPQQAGELHEQTANLLVHLSDPAQALPASRFKTLNLDPVELAAEMRPLVEGLGQMVEEVGREERQTDATLITRIEAFEAFNRTFLWIARMVESLFRLADLPEVAKRVRPSTRRRGLTAEVEAEASETETEDAETADQDGTPEASPEDPSEDQPEAPSEDPPVAA
ncbi:MAG: hypothetical protein GY719_12745 [bacterium]|nr:hypothetical protein [bacterium]